ncbi:MAG: 50S ribosomal protein L29 [Clostridia bacterium]|nr:50S ribosomal protein L29 [Clostridia bacterium]MBR2453289.1 50S ribosomal protein L29 [Clostridia bacterium]
MKINEIRDLSSQEIVDKIQDLKEELFNLRFQNAMNQLDNPMRIVAVKKDIAKLKTVLKEQELGLNANINK